MPFAQLAERYGTPLYVYSLTQIESQAAALFQAFGGQVHPHYAVKANSNAAILDTVFKAGMGADVVSGGELLRVLHAGGAARQTVFSGVGKQDWELELGLARSIEAFHAEGADELGRLDTLARRLGKTAHVRLRVNPNIDAQTLPYIATGLHQTKFGIAESDLEAAVRLARSLSGLKLTGLSCHLGSQIQDAGVFRQAAEALVRWGQRLREGHPEFDSLDVGGGLGVRYQTETPPTVAAYAAALAPVAQAGFRLLIEPGRWIVAEAGTLLTRVITVKSTPAKNFIVVDAAMNDLLRPALYEAFHPIAPVQPHEGIHTIADVVGPVCETGDFLGLDRRLPPVQAGDLLAIGVAGAYGASMASNYNSRPLPAEVAVRGSQSVCIRERQTIEEIFAREKKIPR